MTRFLLKVFLLFVICFYSAFTCFAYNELFTEQIESSGANELYDNLTAEQLEAF